MFVLSLAISVWLGLASPIYSQNPQNSDREALIEDIKEFANRHVQNEKAMDTSLVIKLYETNAFGLTAPEIANIYEDEYTRLKEIKDADVWEKINDNLFNGLGWSIALIVGILFFLKEKLTNWIENLYSKTGDWLYNQVSGLKFFWSVSLKRYRGSLFNKYQQLKIPFRPNRPLEMKDIFVPLKVSGKSDNSQIDAFDAISKYPRLMIKGSPGSGKSMLLKYLAFSWADEKSSKISTNFTPVLLELNRLNELEKFDIDNLQTKLVEAFKREDFPEAKNFIGQALDNGNLMLLLDGLDEVNSNVRDRVINLIKDLLDTYEQCPVIITCRSAVYHNEFNNCVDQTLEIVEFSDRQIRNFLKVWEPELPPEKSINQLISTLRDRPQIITLARNPLLLTIIAYLYADKQFILPHSRAAFYEEAVTHLLKLRDEERQIPNQFEAIHKRRVLQKLALFAQDNASLQERDRRNIEYEQVVEQIRALLPSLNLNPEQETKAILAEIVDRSGLLLPIDGGQRYQFSHLTLQEYFAAEALSNQEEELVNRFKQDSVTWRETVKLWCGLTGDKTPLIKQVHQHDALTGFECLADAKEVEQTLADEIIDYYKQQLEKVIVDDDLAKAFGAVAADLRENSRRKSVFDFLETVLNDNSGPSKQQASAKALSFTNLPQAAKILAQEYKRKQEYCENLVDQDHKNCLENIRESLVRMGDLAVPQLAILAEKEDIKFIQDLTKIATPDASIALVPFLWHPDESICFSAAWSLAELFIQNDNTEALKDIELTAEQKNEKDLDWIWQPFNDSSSKSLSIIACRIVDMLDRTPTELMPNSLPQLDPRLIIPLLSIHDPINIPSDPEWNSLTDSLLEQQKQTPEIEEKINEQVNHILGTPFSSASWSKILSTLKPRLQLDLINRFANQRRPNISDWRNLFLEIEYQFKSSYHYRLVLAMGIIASIMAIAEIVLLVLRQPDNWNNVAWGFPIYVLFVFWVSFWKGIEERLKPSTFLQLGLFGILTFGTKIQRLFKDNLVWAEISLVNESAFATSFGFYTFGFFGAFITGYVISSSSIVLANVANVAGVIGATGMFAIFGLSTIKDNTFWSLFVSALFAAALYLESALAASFVVVVFSLIGIGIGVWDRAKTKKDWIRFLAILAFPYFCWFPIVVVFSTRFMLRFLTLQSISLNWLIILGTWFIVLGTCTTLWRYGQDRERKASNPLKGILDGYI
ncbi:NACHT domain-containing protein [Xenococcus sp. PCC 7305]|uniref:NACHT domain-containing protein n=1 Tax=Xenococcus sp. PCC 7305 TaxID=102125 RepID=UPI0002D52B8E|nr:NACHT domain-containing protein [Xenococcus sp. PCC 7305]